MSRAASAAAPHGAMPHQLEAYWVHGKGAAEIGWGGPGDYDKCVVALTAAGVPEHEVHGVCGNLHELATGMSTAEHAKLLRGGHGSAAHHSARLAGGAK